MLPERFLRFRHILSLLCSDIWERTSICGLDAEWQPNSRTPKATLVQLALRTASKTLILLLASPSYSPWMRIIGAPVLQTHPQHSASSGPLSVRCHAAESKAMRRFLQDVLALAQQSAKAFLQSLFRSPTVVKVRR